MSKEQILVIEDDDSIADFVRRGLIYEAEVRLPEQPSPPEDGSGEAPPHA